MRNCLPQICVAAVVLFYGTACNTPPSPEELKAPSLVVAIDSSQARQWKEEGDTLFLQGANAEALVVCKKSMDLYAQALPQLLPEYLYACHSYSRVLVAQGDYKGAKELILPLLAQESESSGKALDAMGMLRMELSGAYNRTAYLRAAAEQSLAALENFKVVDNKLGQAEALKQLGTTYHQLLDFQKAFEYFQRSEQLFQKELPSGDYRLAATHLNLANSQTALGHYPEAQAYIQKAETLFNTALGVPNQFSPNLHYTRGYTAYEAGDYKLSLENFNAAKALWTQFIGPTFPGIAAVESYRSVNWEALGDFDKAHQFASEAIRIAASTNHADLPTYWQEKGLLFEKEGKFAEALNCAEQALEKGGLQATDLLSDQVDFNIQYFIPALFLRARIQQARFEKEGNQTFLWEARKDFNTVIKTINYLRIFLEEPLSRQVLYEEIEGLYDWSIRNRWHLLQQSDTLDFVEEAFQLAEQSRALLLSDQLKLMEALKFAGLPEKLLQKEEQIKTDLLVKEQEYYQLSQDPSADVTGLKEEVLKGKEAYRELQKELENNYPKYYRIKYEQAPVSIAALRKDYLREDQALLEYFVGDSTLYLFLLVEGEMHLEKVKKDFPLEDWIKQCRAGITDYFYQQENFDLAALQYAHAAQQLYQKLIAPVATKIPEGKALLLVPDGVLANLPFEVLLRKKPAKATDFRHHAYLLRDHPVSYAYAASLLREVHEEDQPEAQGSKRIAFAPAYSATKSLGYSPLRKNQTEAQRIAKIIGGKSYLGSEATEENFKRMASQAYLLHLAAHGILVDSDTGEDSYIALRAAPEKQEDGRLFIREIYELQTPAEMVVLSACETALGQTWKGEGVISLARAFRYAGAQSIVPSLWKVDDENAVDLMDDFYQYLNEGFAKDIALQKAKLDYLEQSHDPDPFFWAGFIPMGDMRPIVPQSSSWKYWALLGTLISGLFLVFLIKRRTT